MNSHLVPPTTRRRDGLALWVGLAACMAAGPMMLYTLSAIAPLVIDALRLSPTQYGAVAGVVFGSAALTALTLSGASGRLGTRTVMAAVSVGSVMGLLVFALAQSFIWVLVAAVLCGAAQALSNPVTNRVAAAEPLARRGSLIGWKQSGVQMAQLTAGITAPVIASLAGWRWAAAAGIAIGVVGVVSALAMRPVPARPDTDVPGSGSPVSIRNLAAYTFFMAFGLMATNAWLPLFAHRRLEFSVAAAGFIAAVIGLVGVASRIWWARRSSASGSSSLLALALGSAVGVGLALLGQWVGAWVVWPGAAIFGACALGSNAVTMVEVIRSVPAAALAGATGVIATGMYVGFAAGPVAFGFALDHAGFGVAWLLPLFAFAAAALIGLAVALPRQLHS